MGFTNEINKVMLVDGILFMLPGISIMLLPSPQSKLNEKVDSKVALPPFKDVRLALGAAYISMGFIIAMLGSIINQNSELNNFARIRAISLIFIVYAGIVQMIKKKWKWSGYRLMYLVLYTLLILIYVFLGFFETLPAY